MDANELRGEFLAFFTERGHVALPSASLVPQDPTVMFTIAGMIPFKGYFVGDEVPTHPRVTTVQRCFRTVDIELVGTTSRHLTFFEMLGNFSFGDYFKAEAIPFSWELLTGALGLDGDRLWVTVHESDEEAETIWREKVGVPAERVQRMGDENFWDPGLGPCGPSSEVHYDRGEAHGAGGGPAKGGGERFVEIWNLVFMQFNRLPRGQLEDLPRRNIDTGAGLERLLVLLQGVESPFETDALTPLVAAAETVTGRRYGESPRTDVALRILADHARSMTFLVSDGVYPSNEGRGYVLRRVIRRAVRRAFQLGVEASVTPRLVEATVDAMSDAYPQLGRDHDFVLGVVSREEDRFRQTLRSGLAILDEELAGGGGSLPGEVAFRLHDTFGFPVELTTEIAAEKGVTVDSGGYEAAMERQRSRARKAAKASVADQDLDLYRELLAQFGPTEFTGYEELESEARVLSIAPAPGGRKDGAGGGKGGGRDDRARGSGGVEEQGRALVDVVLDRTPFYAEAGGQVGDTGTIVGGGGRLEVTDTTTAVPGLVCHRARLVDGHLEVGQAVTATVDAKRRLAIRRNHTGTHLLHWALRSVIGPHVKQQGSLVAPDRLRFDFSHHAPVSGEEIRLVERMVNERVLADEAVTTYVTTRAHAEEVGAVAFFDEKYGEKVRVVEAGSDSIELCGGTHVGALGMIGPLKVVSESSIGANTRRIEAVTGESTLSRMESTEDELSEAAGLLRASPDEVPRAVSRLLARQREMDGELRRLRRAETGAQAERLLSGSEDGTVVARVDGLDQERLRDLALAVRGHEGIRAVVLVGSPDGKRVALAAAVKPESDLAAPELVSGAARRVGGGGGGRDPQVAVAGGRDPGAIEDALALLREQLGRS
jgi:alanyl-tRNA synthetase